jgi:tetratricopeptide (TPR) repeat protein
MPKFPPKTKVCQKSTLRSQRIETFGRNQSCLFHISIAMDIQQIADQLDIEDEEISDLLSALAIQAYTRYKSSGNGRDIDFAIQSARLIVRATPNGHPDRAGRLDDLGAMLGSRYDRTGEIGDLEEALAMAKLAVAAATEGHSDHAVFLNNLGVLLAHQYKRTGDMAHLEEAITAARRAVVSTHEDRAARLDNLGGMLGSRFERSGDITDLEQAIAMARQAVALTPEGHPDRATFLNNLGNRLQVRYKQRGKLADLKEAISVARQAVMLTPEGHPSRAGWLNNLGNSLANQYEQTGELADLDQAIAMARQVEALAPQDYPYRPVYLNNLGCKLARRFDRTGDMADIQDAISATREAVARTTEDHPNRAAYLNNLGTQLETWHNWTGRKGDLEEAITAARQAIASLPENHADRAAKLNNLGNRLQVLYDRKGDMADLEEAISVARQAVALTPEGHLDRATRFKCLGTVLGLRYERRGEMADLDEAITVARQALALMPEDHPARAAKLDNLGTQLSRRYKRTGKMADLEEAISMTRQAVVSTPEDHPFRTGVLNNLGCIIGSWYERTGKMADLEQAIKMARQAVASTPEGHPDRATFLNNLGIRLNSLYDRTGDMADLEETISVARQAVASTPEGQPDHATFLTNLGVVLAHRYERTEETADIDEALICLRLAWSCQTAIPFHRIKAAARCLKLLAIQHKTEVGASLGRDIIDLLPTVNTRLLERSDQQFVMATFAGVASELCAFLLESGQPEDALQYLEKGRAVILSQLVDSRSDVSDLAKQHPDLARRYQRLLDEVNTPVRRLEPGHLKTQALERRLEALAELDACIWEIRTVPGCERFLLGQTIVEMQQCAVGGGIVVVNITDLRSDAIVVFPSAIKAMKLPRLSASEAKAWLSKKWTGRRSEHRQKNAEYSKYLSWIWDVCVEQILEEIHAVQYVSEHGPPRIWWIGTGLANSMPFHAAGTHSVESANNAYSMAISSYAPSIKALAYAQNRAKRTASTQGSLLMAIMPTTPGLRDLPGVMLEKDKVLQVVDGHLPTDSLDNPSVNQIIDGLQRCSIAHFACHGSTDHSDPSNSGLILQKSDGSEAAREDRLTVHMMSELSLAHARLAYLSACSTAENKVAQLADEVIHVVSGFQVAGFPHTIGCLWPSVDRVCVEVAKLFYVSLLRDSGWSDRDVASALREAVMAVRITDPRTPLNWAQFVHYGA